MIAISYLYKIIIIKWTEIQEDRAGLKAGPSKKELLVAKGQEKAEEKLHQ